MKRNKFNTKLFNILKYVGIVLVVVMAAGLISSLFSGNVGGDGVRRPSVNRPSIEGTEGTDGSSGGGSWESSTETEVPDVPDNPTPLLGKSAPVQDNFNIYVGAEDLKTILEFKVLGKKLSSGAGIHELCSEENGTQYIRIYGDGTSGEAYAFMDNIEGETTGKYLVFAYRLPTSNTINSSFQIYANTCDESVTGSGDMFWLSNENDGKWHVSIIDLEQAIASTSAVVAGNTTNKFVANSDGTYSIHRLRLDWFNNVASTEDYIDVAYIGICDDLDKAISADPDYTLAEFTAQDLSKLSTFSETLYYENGMEYAKFGAFVPSNGEVVEYLHHSNVALNGTSRYVAIMYRNAPYQYLELHINCAADISENGWYSRGHFYYEAIDDKWHLGIIELPYNSDTFCRSLKVDFGNQLSANSFVSMDVAFIKFFSSREEATAYYQNYFYTYNLNAE